jgi:hypothetical protein
MREATLGEKIKDAMMTEWKSVGGCVRHFLVFEFGVLFR